jgi:hypothetical protein
MVNMIEMGYMNDEKGTKISPETSASQEQTRHEILVSDNIQEELLWDELISIDYEESDDCACWILPRILPSVSLGVAENTDWD